MKENGCIVLLLCLLSDIVADFAHNPGYLLFLAKILRSQSTPLRLTEPKHSARNRKNPLKLRR